MKYYENNLIASLNTENLTPAEVKSRHDRMHFLSIMVLIKGSTNDDYFIMMHAAIYGINKGLTDDQILSYLDVHLTYPQMCALADLINDGISDDMFNVLKRRTHTYNALGYNYIPHIDEAEEMRLALQREHRQNMRHMSLSDLTQMNNKRGTCSHYYFINGVPVSLVDATESDCKLCGRHVSNNIMSRLNEAISSFDAEDELVMPNTYHYDEKINWYRLRDLGII